MTFQQALIHATKVMTQAGVTTPQVDARRLLCAATGISPDRLTLHMPDPLGPTEVDVFESHVAKRCNGVPVSHLVGGRQFYGRWFKVTPDVLDPRPETETLVVAAITEPFQKALDLGVGSGALLVTLMLEQEKAAGTGVDLISLAS